MPTEKTKSTSSIVALTASSTRPTPFRRHRLPPKGIFALLVFLIQACSAGSSDPVIVSDGPDTRPRGDLVVEPATFLVTEGETLNLTAKLGGTVVGASQVTWTVTPSNVATVNAYGALTALQHGDATVTARYSSVQGTSVGYVRAVPYRIKSLVTSDPVGIVGRAVHDSIAILAESKDGVPVPGVEVSFDAPSAEGTVSQSVKTTGRDGLAKVSWRLGPGAGTQTLRAHAGSLGEVNFQAEALADYDSAQVAPLAGDGQDGVVATYLPDALLARVTDQFGNPLPGLALQWSFLAGGGTDASLGDPALAVGIVNTTADADGRTEIFWKLGTLAGEQEVELYPISGSSSGPSAGSAAVSGPEAGSDNGQRKGWYKWRANGKPADPDRVLIIPEEITELVGDESLLQATLADAFGNYIDGGEFNWWADNSGVVEIVGNGRVKGMKAGRGAVFAETVEGTFSASAWVNVEARVATSLHPNAGDDQTGEVGMPLPSPVSLQVLDQGGAPVAGVEVLWSVVEGASAVPGFGPNGSPAGGEPGSPVTVTNEQGVAQTSWVLGTSAGQQVLEAVAGTLAPLQFSAEAQPGDMVALSLSPGQAEVPAGLTHQFTAEGQDAFGNAIPDPSVSWTVDNSSVATVESSGLVRGKAEGTTKVRATSGAVQASADVIVTQGGPASVAIAGGNEQTGPVAQTLPEPLALKVSDANGLPVEGVEVTWSVTAGVGGVNPSSSLTAADGVATAEWTLGTSLDDQEVQAQAGDLPPVAFSATAEAGPAASVSVVPTSVTMQLGSTGQFLASAEDEFGNPVSSGGFSWTTGSSLVATVDATGKVTARGVGSTVVKAARDGKEGTAQVSVTSSVVNQIQVIDGDGQSASAGSSLPNPIRVQVSNASGIPVEGTSVTWQVASGGGSVSPGRSFTDPEGYAEAIWTLGNSMGEQTISASLDQGGAVAFTAMATTESRVEITPDSLSFSALNEKTSLSAHAFDSFGELIPDAPITWTSLDPGIATVTQGGEVTSKAWGLALIVASAVCCSASDTAVVSVQQAVVSPPVILTPSVLPAGRVGETYSFPMTASGGDGQYTWSLTGGTSLPTGLSLNSGNGFISGTPSLAGTTESQVQVSSGGQTATGTFTLSIAPVSQTISGDTIELQITRLDGGTGTALVSNGIPLTPGLLRPGDESHVALTVGGVEQSVYVEPLRGRHPDGSLRAILLQFRSDVGGAPVAGNLIVGSSVTRSTSDIAKTPVTWMEPQAVALPTSPHYLVGTWIVGPTIPVSETPAIPSFFQTYESEFQSYGDLHWTNEPASWDPWTADYYDRALLWYAWWARTGDVEYWVRGTETAYYYHQWLAGADYDTQPNNQQMEGMELRYLLVGDEAPRVGIVEVANFNDLLFTGSYVSAPGGEGRIQARVIMSFLLAHRTGDTSKDWAAKAEDIVTKSLASQNPDDGSYDGFQVWDFEHVPYMTGMLHEAFAEYYHWISPDPRIPPAVKAALDWEWNNMWVAGDQALKYRESSTSGSPDLNGLEINGYGWYYMISRDPTYLDRGEALFKGLVERSWIDGIKQFNQSYRSSYRYLYYRR